MKKPTLKGWMVPVILAGYAVLLYYGMSAYISASLFRGYYHYMGFLMIALQYTSFGLRVFIVEKMEKYRTYANILNAINVIVIVLANPVLLAILMHFESLAVSLTLAMICLLPQVVYLVAKVYSPKKFPWIFTAVFGSVILIVLTILLHLMIRYDETSLSLILYNNLFR